MEYTTDEEQQIAEQARDPIEMTIIWRDAYDALSFHVDLATHTWLATNWKNQTDGDVLTFATCATPSQPSRMIMLRLKDVLCIC